MRAGPMGGLARSRRAARPTRAMKDTKMALSRKRFTFDTPLQWSIEHPNPFVRLAWYILLIGCATAAIVSWAGCSSTAHAQESLTAPSAPTSVAVIPNSEAEYIAAGDSVGLLGHWWPSVEQVLPPHRFLNEAIGSTYLHTNWQPPAGSAWTALLNGLATTALTPTVFLVHIGANDTVLQPPPTEASVFADLQTFAAGLHQLAPNSVMYLAEVGQVWTYGDKRAENAQVLAAIHRAWTDIPGVRPGPLMQDLTPDDGVHFTGDTNTQIIGDRWRTILALGN